MSSSRARGLIVGLGAVVIIGAVTLLVSEGAQEPATKQRANIASPAGSRSQETTTVRSLPKWLQEATLEPGSEPTPLRVVRPSSGEGSPRAQLPPEEKAEAAIAEVESAIEDIRDAETDEKKGELRELAAAKLSGVRAELWATDEGRRLYLNLQSELESA